MKRWKAQFLRAENSSPRNTASPSESNLRLPALKTISLLFLPFYFPALLERLSIFQRDSETLLRLSA